MLICVYLSYSTTDHSKLIISSDAYIISYEKNPIYQKLHSTLNSKVTDSQEINSNGSFSISTNKSLFLTDSFNNFTNSNKNKPSQATFKKFPKIYQNSSNFEKNYQTATFNSFQKEEFLTQILNELVP